MSDPAPHATTELGAISQSIDRLAGAIGGGDSQDLKDIASALNRCADALEALVDKYEPPIPPARR